MSHILELCPERVTRVRRRPSIHVSEGHSRARARYERTRPAWLLAWDSFPDHGLPELRRFLATVGGFTSFPWTPPDEASPRTMRVLDGSFVVQHTARGVAAVELQLEEVL